MRFHELGFLVMLICLLLILISPVHSLTQKTFTLDLNNPIFRYEENAMNNSKTSEDLIFSGNQNITRYITIPKNSTILYVNVTLTGKITPSQTYGAGVSYYSVAVGNVTSDENNEIVIGRHNSITLLNSTPSEICSFSTGSGITYGVAIGNITIDTGKEIAIATATSKLFLINASCDEIWNYSVAGEVRSVDIGDIDSDGKNEIVAGTSDSTQKVVVLNSSKNVEWKDSTVVTGTAYAVAIGDVKTDIAGKEIAVGDNTQVYLLNSTGGKIWNHTIGTSILSIDVGNVLSDTGDEIVIGTSNGTVYLLNSTNEIKWSFSVGGAVYGVSIGDITSEYLGNEIVIGSGDDKVYALNSSGSFIWSYTAGDDIYGVSIGDINQNETTDPMNETAAVSIDTHLYILNFEYFPTNTSLDIGGNGNYDWNYSGKLRSSVNLPNSTLVSAIQDYLNNCNSQLCDVPFVFHSDASGDLEVSSINITYDYNASEAISSSSDGWSRRVNILVNESIGNESINISFSNPANDVSISYIKIDSTATKCDFAGQQFGNVTINGINYCNISSLGLTLQHGSSGYYLLWDNSMPTDVPVLMNSTDWYSEGIYYYKNLTIWNETPTVFSNVTANFSLDESIVKSNQNLTVYWNGSWCDLTPSSSTPDCNSTDPTYTSKTCGSDTFYVCMQDTNGNNIVDFFKWKQPHTSSTVYKIGGSGNMAPVVENLTVSPLQAIWGSTFNFSADVFDEDVDNVTVRLYVYLPKLDTWILTNSTNITGNGTVSFLVTSNKSWVGQSKFIFEFWDNNKTSGEVFHDPQNVTNSSYPIVLKHNVSIIYVVGNESDVNRTGLIGNVTLLSVRINDTDEASYVGSGVNCSLWITKDGNNFILFESTQTDSSGFCNFTFDPDSSISVGKQRWKIGTFNDYYYLDKNSTSFTVNVYGKLNINLTDSVIGKNFTRQVNNLLTAKLLDEFNNLVEKSGYNCSWFIYDSNNSLKDFTWNLTNSSGYCNFTWIPDCSYSVGNYTIKVNFTGDAISDYYFIDKDEDQSSTILKDTLNVTILNPSEGFIIHKPNKTDETVLLHLNSSVLDSCGQKPSGSYSVSWSWNDSCKSDCFSSIYSDIENATWQLQVSCGTCNPTITSMASGDLYNSDTKSVKIYVYGWSDVHLEIPPENKETVINRTKFGEIYKIICYVRDHAEISSPGISNYPVDFWYSNTTLEEKICTNNTGSDGNATCVWNISNDLLADGWYNVSCNISDLSSGKYYNTSIHKSLATVKIFGVSDNVPPEFEQIYIPRSVELTDMTNVTLSAEVIDLYGIDKVWVNVTYPNSSSFIFYLENTSKDTSDSIWNYTLKNLTLGDYDFILYANDTTGWLTTYEGWFEVYLPAQFYGTINNPSNENITAEVAFYRNGTGFSPIYQIHSFKTNSSWGWYNITAHKRLYDIKIRVFDNEIKLYSVNISHDINDSLKFQKFSVEIAKAEQPLGVRHYISDVPFAVKTTLNFTKSEILINYSSVYDDYKNLERYIEEDTDVFQCSDWNFTQNPGCLSEWKNIGGDPDTNSHTILVETTSLSGFFIGDTPTPGDGICDVGETSDRNSPYFDPACLPGGGTTVSGGGGGGTRGTTTTSIPVELIFSVRTNLTNIELEPGETKNYALWVLNNANRKINVSINVFGTAYKFIKLEKGILSIEPKKEEMSKITISIPKDAEPGIYTAEVIVSGEGKTESIPVTVTVSMKGAAYLDVMVEALTKRVGVNETAKFHVMLYNLGFRKRLDLKLNYTIKDFYTEAIVYQENEKKLIETSESFVKSIDLSKLQLSPGRYIFEVRIAYDGKEVSASDDFNVVKSFWTSKRIAQITLISVVTLSTISFLYGRKKYIAWKLSKARYIFPVDYRKLPRGKLWLGKIAETNVRAEFNMNDLMTHVLIAGATGAGKSVSAMVFVEELLKEGIPVIVFDPTAQWTGFVRACRDPELFKYYKAFGMKKKDARPYAGMIYEVTTPNVKIDFKKYMNPGEITVFTLNKLKPGEYDDAVRNIVDTIFAQGWEESTHLRLVIVFDEVHRLLEKYGGKGGYVALERACREFRKWGIGLIMISQVLSDFKEAIKGNVLTEVQLHTKSLGDLNRIEKKYGVEYAKKVTKLEVGVGMMQNPKYNDGKPWFISFRPTLHEPHKLPDEDLKIYKEYATLLEKFEKEIERLKKEGKDVFDLETELKLAKDKLKKGRFRMAKIYIDSLSKTLSKG